MIRNLDADISVIHVSYSNSLKGSSRRLPCQLFRLDTWKPLLNSWGGGSSSVARNQAPTDDGGNVQRTPVISNQQPRTTGGIKCFRYGEVGHRQSKCKAVGKRVLFAETNEENVAEIGDEPQFDDKEMTMEDLVEGDVGPLLMVRPALVTIDDKFTPDKVEERCHSVAAANKETSLCIGDHSATSLEVLKSGDIVDKHGAAMVTRRAFLTPCADESD
ncbi:hypothetical protein LWI28_015897 [Acer negundo]|uniref:Uncharacterized protein n=1 Tax=Acer negundo TaxID=4023 RepID=A0AAD5NHF1_ACENE|nr:hypothetical protein LWI28_015897 [Acer negundo]